MLASALVFLADYEKDVIASEHIGYDAATNGTGKRGGTTYSVDGVIGVVHFQLEMKIKEREVANIREAKRQDFIREVG
jgi:hypothetical protein